MVLYGRSISKRKPTDLVIAIDNSPYDTIYDTLKRLFLYFVCRYTGSFKPTKSEPTGEGAQPIERGYEQPAFYVSSNKPPKGGTMA